MNILEYKYTEATQTATRVLQIAEAIPSLSTVYRGSIVEASSSKPLPKSRAIGPRQPVSNVIREPLEQDLLQLQPANNLELSRKFFPESYTSQSRVQSLVIASLCEQSFDGARSMNFYRVLYGQNS
jgi:hypothetical protein